jgi:hypothetical protein
LINAHNFAHLRWLEGGNLRHDSNDAPWARLKNCVSGGRSCFCSDLQSISNATGKLAIKLSDNFSARRGSQVWFVDCITIGFRDSLDRLADIARDPNCYQPAT